MTPANSRQRHTTENETKMETNYEQGMTITANADHSRALADSAKFGHPEALLENPWQRFPWVVTKKTSFQAGEMGKNDFGGIEEPPWTEAHRMTGSEKLSWQEIVLPCLRWLQDNSQWLPQHMPRKFCVSFCRSDHPEDAQERSVMIQRSLEVLKLTRFLVNENKHKAREFLVTLTFANIQQAIFLVEDSQAENQNTKEEETSTPLKKWEAKPLPELLRLAKVPGPNPLMKPMGRLLANLRAGKEEGRSKRNLAGTGGGSRYRDCGERLKELEALGLVEQTAAGRWRLAGDALI